MGKAGGEDKRDLRMVQVSDDVIVLLPLPAGTGKLPKKRRFTREVGAGAVWKL